MEHAINLGLLNSYHDKSMYKLISYEMLVWFCVDTTLHFKFRKFSLNWPIKVSLYIVQYKYKYSVNKAWEGSNEETKIY